MGKKEYIEREAAIKRFNFAVLDCLGMESTIRAGDIIKALESVSAADVREVVTCDGCKFWDRERISCEGLARCNTGESGVRYRSRNDFCSRGIKMEES